MRIYCGRSVSGKLILSENGGGATNTGQATCIAGPTGERLVPFYVPKGYSNGNHADFVVEVGMIVAKAERDRGGESVSVYRVDRLEGVREPPEAVLSEPVYTWSDGDQVGDQTFEAVAKAALDKTHCYHCREPHYIVGR